MKNMRLWQKTYLLTMLLCTLALAGGLLFIGAETQRRALETEVESSKSELAFMAQSLNRDMAAIESLPQLRIPLLFTSYGSYYEQAGILYELRTEQEVLASNLPAYNGERAELATEAGTISWLQRTVEGSPYIYTTSRLAAPYEAYLITYARPLAALYTSWQGMRQSLVVGAVLVTGVLAVLLFFVLKSISMPLARLARTADKLAEGDLAARAPLGGGYEINALAESFNTMAAATSRHISEIATAAEQNQRLAANLSHEIRTPLTSIQGYAEYMRLAPLSEEEQAAALGYIIEESGRLQKISQRMLQLFTLKQEDIAEATADLAAVAARAVRTFSPIAEKKGVILVSRCAPTLPIPGDEVLLESLVSNLLENAIKATPPGGHVTLSLKKSGATSTLAVEDEGRGITPEALQKLGEPFYRPDKARSRQEGGAGLGVALSYEIARLHSANLTYTSELGKGTRATVLFTTL